jgi:hypothetical protein
MRAFASFPSNVAWLILVPLAAGCGPSPVHVNGVMRESSEMRPLRNLPAGAYGQLRVLVRADSDPDQKGSDCAAAPLEGAEGHNNAACIPADAGNVAVRLVRQRLRSYGMGLARDAKEPYDYEVRVIVAGVAPKTADPMGAQAVARVTFKRGSESDASGFFSGIDPKAASASFDAVAKDCALQDAELGEFSATSNQPMTPDFDINALASDAVDNAVGCDELARFFLDAKTRFPPPTAPSTPAH